MRPDAAVRVPSPASELGLVGDIGLWALERACRQIKTWHERFPAHPHLFISLDLSEDQLCDQNFADDIHRVLDETGIAPRLLCLEVNEGTIINDPEEVAITMVKLKEMGVRIAMDNFGTGHSSLNCLHEFPFHLLKIDRSIIATDDHRKRPSRPSCTP